MLTVPQGRDRRGRGVRRARGCALLLRAAHVCVGRTAPCVKLSRDSLSPTYGFLASSALSAFA
jgi:hypothetical protein